MSGPESSSKKPMKIALKPGKPPLPVALVIKKDRSITIRANDTANLMETFKFSPQTLRTFFFKEDIIYESSPNDFLKVNPLEKVVIVNILDRLANVSRTVARYYSTSTNEVLRELTSDNVVKLIGQNSYNTVFSALCSVINLESKVRGILSLLTAQEDSKETLCKPEKIDPLKIYEEKCCQTEENCMDVLFKDTEKKSKKKRMRRSHIGPYVVTDNLLKTQKRVVVYPNKETNRKLTKFVESNSIKSQCNSNISLAAVDDAMAEHNSQIESLPDIKNLLTGEDSNCSIGNLSVLSNFSADNLLELKNPNELLKNVDRYTNTDSNITTTKLQADTTEEILNRDNWPKITFPDGSEIRVPVKPEDNFHIATPEILKCIPHEERIKLLVYQLSIDGKYCLEQDSDGYMPIHIAVINDDVDMLRRQCIVLRRRQHNVDVLASNLTPLQMALLQDTPHCGALVATLLRYGADALLADSELRAPAHLAAEAPLEALQAYLAHCRKEARSILEDHEELWKPEYATKSDGDLARLLLDHVCNSFDGQGYTPLMVAGRQGLHRSVELLLEASPHSVNTQTPNAGDTALHIAVGAACMRALDSSNKWKVPEQFQAAVTALVAAGADASIENLAGTNVNDLLSENNIPELSLLVGNKITSMLFFNGKMLGDAKNCDDYMLEDIAGEVSIKEVVKRRKVERGKVKAADKAGGGGKKRNIKVDETEVSGKIADGNDIGSDEDRNNINDKPIILENIELPKIDAIKHSNAVFINSSNVKFIKPQDILEKISSNATAGSVTNLRTASSDVTTQNISKLDVTSNNNVKTILPNESKKIVVVNFNRRGSAVGNATLNSNLKIVTTNTVAKRTQTTTQDCLSAKKLKVVFNPTDDKNT